MAEKQGGGAGPRVYGKLNERGERTGKRNDAGGGGKKIAGGPNRGGFGEQRANVWAQH